MSTNGKTFTKLSMVNAVKACEAMKTHREDIEKTCRNHQDVRNYLAGKIGAVIPKSSLNYIIEASGVDLKLLSSRNSPQSASENKRILLKAITRLHEEMGVTLEADFLVLFERSFGRPYRSPVPVASVPPTSQIPVVRK